MARFRVGNVRFGGGRKASIGFHAGPVGVTFGGRRRRSSSYGSSAGSEVPEIEWDSLSDSEKARFPLKNMLFDWDTVSDKDRLMLESRKSQQRNTRMWLLGIAAFFVLFFFSVLAGVALVIYGLLSLLCSGFFIRTKILATKADKTENPSVSQLKAWSFFNDGLRSFSYGEFVIMAVASNLVFVLLGLLVNKVFTAQYSDYCGDEPISSKFEAPGFGISDCGALEIMIGWIHAGLVISSFAIVLSIFVLIYTRGLSSLFTGLRTFVRKVAKKFLKKKIDSFKDFAKIRDEAKVAQADARKKREEELRSKFIKKKT